MTTTGQVKARARIARLVQADIGAPLWGFRANYCWQRLERNGSDREGSRLEQLADGTARLRA